jgi:ubiquinone/menaquinone biosynthesis C-methylase UbiE
MMAYGDAEIYSEYDRFAWFYNRHWGDEFCRPVLDIFQFILFPHIKPGSRILDLCCGTGQLAAGLIEKGYRVTGSTGRDPCSTTPAKTHLRRTGVG